MCFGFGSLSLLGLSVDSTSSSKYHQTHILVTQNATYNQGGHHIFTPRGAPQGNRGCNIIILYRALFNVLSNKHVLLYVE